MNFDKKEKIEQLKNQISIIDEKSETIAHKDDALKRLDVSFNKHIELLEYKISNLLAYWIKDFSQYHDDEKTFNPSSLKIFKRGDVIKVNLGFNIGNELGGLHYCVVISKKDNHYSGTLNVIPLSSIKDKNYNEYSCLNIGNELYRLLLNKYENLYDEIKQKTNNFTKTNNFEPNEVSILLKKLDYINKIKDEILKMKKGSIALINQITTISKQRIFKTPILSGIRLSNTTLDLIDKRIINNFTK